MVNYFLNILYSPFLHLIHDEEAQIEHEFKHAHQILIKNIQLAVMTIPDK
jgi:hypothetical protein